MASIVFYTAAPWGTGSSKFHTHTEITWNVSNTDTLRMVVSIHEDSDKKTHFRHNNPECLVGHNIPQSLTSKTDLGGAYAWLSSLPMTPRTFLSLETVLAIMFDPQCDLRIEDNSVDYTRYDTEFRLDTKPKRLEPLKISINALMQSTQDAVERFFDDPPYLLK